MALGVFSKPNGERDYTPGSGPAAPEKVSTIGQGMLITGNVVCEGAVQIFGRVVGDIHTAHLVVCEGAEVEGNIIAQNTIIQGTFKGTLHSNVVRLRNMAVVEGEIYNKSLSIEENAQFEGVSRRLERSIDSPSNAQAKTAPSPALADAATAAAERMHRVIE